MKNLLWSVGMLLGLVADSAGAEEPWQSPVGPDGVTRIVVEAEEMQGVNWKAFGGGSPEWRVGRHGYDLYQNNIFGGHWQSRTRTAMTDAGSNPAEISALLNVPKAGPYKLWVKYECPPYFNYAFEVILTPVGAAAPSFRKTFGLIDNPKHFSFTDKLTTGSLYWPWGIDHDAAEGYPVDLPQGPCKLILRKAPNPAPAGMRSIDVVMLTDDLSEISSPRFSRYPLLDELRRANHVFLRFRVPQEAPGPVQVTWNRWGKRYNDFYSAQYMDLVRYYDANGTLIPDGRRFGLEGPLRTGQIPQPLQPGETSVWLDVGPTLNVESAATFFCQATVVDGQGKPVDPQPAFIPLGADIALAPHEKKIVKRFDLRPGETGGELTFLLQPDLNTAEGRQYSLTLAEVYRRITQALDSAFKKAPMPRRMRFYGFTASPLTKAEPWAWELAMDFRRAQGLNTVFGSALDLKPEDLRKQQEWYRQRRMELLRSACIHHSQEVEEIAQKLQALGTEEQFHYLSYGDEIGLPAIAADHPERVAAFQEYLRQRGVTPEKLGLPAWDQVKPLTALSPEVAVQIGVLPEAQRPPDLDRTLKRLYWHSVQFQVQQGVQEFARKTARFRQLLGPEVHTSANLGGMHPFYWMPQSSFIELFKHRALSLAWTEDYDYCQPEASRLVVEFQAGYLKAGTKYHKQRMMFYCMPHYPGNSPEHLLQNVVLVWGQNVKDIDWFCTVPDGFSTENYVSVRGGLPTFKAMRTASAIAGTVEDWLEPAQPVDAPVALLLSEASDLWEAGGLGQGAVAPGSEPTNAFQEERKNTYYVLRNAGYRVDLITEADVRDGYLQRYRALYVGGENLERATVQHIVSWVEKGGVLYASAGAGRKDEYDEPLRELDSVLGRGDRLAYRRYRGPLRAKLELPFLRPLDTVLTREGQGFPALATKETFQPLGEATVLATYTDGMPAFVRHAVGRGAAYYIGTFPATAWLQKALPRIPCGRGGPEKGPGGSPRYPSFEPVDFQAAAGAAVLRPLADAGIRPDIRTDRPHVVCNRLEGPRGTVIPMVNLGWQRKGAVGPLTLAIDGIGRPAKLWSYGFPKGLKAALQEDTLTVQIPRLEQVDVVVIEKREGINRLNGAR